jgi:ABC-type transport system substrate-binding protein
MRRHQAIFTIEAPDPSTLVFTLKYPSASLLANLAAPWNVIYPKKYLETSSFPTRTSRCS